MPTTITTIMKSFFVMGMIACVGVMSEKIVSSNSGIRASNVLGGADEHASFSFVRPGLTQTSYSFNGPSSHQSFSSSIGNPNLAYRVSPNVAQAIAYRNPGLGYFSTAPISTGYANSPYVEASSGIKSVISGLPSSGLVSTTAYADPNQQYQRGEANHEAQTQLQLQQQLQHYPDISIHQAHLNQLLAANQQQQHEAQLQSHGETWRNFVPAADEFGRLQISEQVKLQQSQYPREQSQNLLGVAYSSAPSVAHVKVSGNGYKFNF